MHILTKSTLPTILLSTTFFGLLTHSSRVPLPSWTGCPPEGSLLPRPTDLSHSRLIQEATTNLSQSLDLALNGTSKAGFEVDDTSFSIAFVSPFDKNKDKNKNPNETNTNDNDGIIWSYHHLGKNNVQGTKHLDDDSQYMIGSVSKIFSDVLLLKSDVDLSDPITKFLPGLGLEKKNNGHQPHIQWDNITLSALSEHLAGIPSNLPSSFEFYSLRSLFQQLGFPQLNNASYPNCGVSGLSHACSEEGIISMMASALPVRAPYSEPTYSTVAFTLFALALTEKTGRSYEQLLDELVITPLGLTNTGVSPGDTDRAVIPPGNGMSQGWGADYGLNAPGGGLYSSLRDLSTLASRILDSTIFPNPDKTRQWLKPQSMTSSLNNLIGRPWEIQRADNLIPDNPHTVDIYAKSGGAQWYVSQFSLVDQFGVGFVVLTAGPREDATVSILNDALFASLIPAIDGEARRQALKYTGRFSGLSVSTRSNNTSKGQNSNSAVEVEVGISLDRGTGLELDSMTRNGSDILTGIQKLWSYMIPQTGILNPHFRIYPTGIESRVDSEGEENVFLEDWRIGFDIVPSDNTAMSDLPGQGVLSSRVCSSWQTAAWLYYGGEALDRVVFKVDRVAGKVLGVDVPFLRSGFLSKV